MQNRVRPEILIRRRD